MTAFPWTKEQETALASTDRITLIQAGPGSGKTKVFAELVDRRLRAWTHERGGLAALSFTNVARAEIEERVCAATVAPHFIGTLDGFFLRFVIAPFGHVAGLPKSGARLIPSPLDQQMTEPAVPVGNELHASIFHLTPAGGTETVPQFQVRWPNGVSKAVSADRAAYVLKKKQDEWKKRGRVTHGDCSYLTACILNGPHGPAIRTMLARRFPVICIDEFQDTGHFLGRAVLALLSEPTVQSIVVGDVDQKIFGFSGVNSGLFDAVEKLAGAKKYPLQISQRCPVRICDGASLLTRSGNPVTPREGAPVGRTLVSMHKDKPPKLDLKTLQVVVKTAREEGCKDLAVLVRARRTKARLLRSVAKTGPSMNSRGATRLSQAVEAIREGRGRQAIEIAETLVCRVLCDDDRPTADEMLAAGVEPTALRQQVSRMLLALVVPKPGETWGEWTSRGKTQCDDIAVAFGISSHKLRLGGAFKAKAGDKPADVRVLDAARALDWPLDIRVEVLTVHEAKGREFDGVFFYCSKPRKLDGLSTCAAEAWWAAAEESEEREVAFVAVTRSKNLLALSVHEETWKALTAKRQDFLKTFEVLPADTAP